jgi:small subunit ribosomal protein S21
LQVLVRDNNIDQALRVLKKKMQREGLFREMKLRKHYEKPSEKESPGESGSRPSRPQARPQKIAARGSATNEASGDPRDWRKRPRSRAPFLSGIGVDNT